MAKNVHGVQTSRDVNVRYFFGFRPSVVMKAGALVYAPVGKLKG